MKKKMSYKELAALKADACQFLINKLGGMSKIKNVSAEQKELECYKVEEDFGVTISKIML